VTEQRPVQRPGLPGSPAGTPPRRGGIPVGRVLGIPVVIAPSWFFIAIVATYLIGPEVRYLLPGQALSADYGIAASVVLLLYLSVFVHELTHSLVARGVGLPVSRIVLQLIGGISEMPGEPATPGVEYLVSAAGPMMSLLLAGIGAAVAAHLSVHTVGGVIAWLFFYSNALVTGLNMLPGLPLDGGRVLRAGLWWAWKDKARATRGAAYSGRILAGLFLAAAVVLSLGRGTGQFDIYTFLWLGIIALFMWQNATYQLAQARLTSALPSLVARGLTRRALPVTADLPVSEAVRRANESNARALVIVDGRGEPDAIVSEAAVQALPMERRPWVNVGSLAHRVSPGLRLSADLTGQDLMAAMAANPAPEYLVVEPSGQIFGVLTQADVLAALNATR
jgi:Zn-dependent protease/CBS domain-containing protein